MEETGIEKARNQLGEIVDKARFTGEPTTITRQGKPAAVVVSSDWLANVAALLDDLEAVAEYSHWSLALRSGAGRRIAGLAPQDRRVVHHIDGDPYNNDPANLRIMNPEENQ
jgi:prevent-host-death family protein